LRAGCGSEVTRLARRFSYRNFDGMGRRALIGTASISDKKEDLLWNVSLTQGNLF
jgi:hypothetical protein